MSIMLKVGHEEADWIVDVADYQHKVSKVVCTIYHDEPTGPFSGCAWQRRRVQRHPRRRDTVLRRRDHRILEHRRALVAHCGRALHQGIH